MEKEILECVLKRNWKDSTPVKVVSMEVVPAVANDVNFLSTVKRYNLKVILGNGRTAKKSFFVKTSSGEGTVSNFTEKLSTFKTEVKMYEALQEFEYIMEESQDSDDVLWCQMIYHIPYSCIVMEDLKAKGFYMIERRGLFDLEHSKLAIHALGRYHGISKILEERGLLSPQGFQPWFIFDEEVVKIALWAINAMVEGIKKMWDPSWTPIVDKIKLTKESLFQKLKAFSELDETKFNLLNHGDCHKNNIVFKYDWDKRPIGIKLVDFQMIHYGSPCLDLNYFMYLSIEPSVRRENFNLLIKTYHDSLLNTLNKYQYRGNKPDLEEILAGMEKYNFVGLYLHLTRYPNLFMSEDVGKQIDIQKLLETGGKEGYALELFKPDPALVDGMGAELKSFAETLS
ncbi:uncharacterized protein [Halyomorpha halys]|uniref:uncharacterized protein n=1 Tax=Halyomorpha halys TaxID=286706 RepID=UPI0006D4E92E|nr:uncharacterized protein LOC106682382 [Halyomorpha halys]